MAEPGGEEKATSSTPPVFISSAISNESREVATCGQARRALSYFHLSGWRGLRWWSLSDRSAEHRHRPPDCFLAYEGSVG
jgi:hypothetical protein